jgi:hypothetical protein
MDYNLRFVDIFLLFVRCKQNKRRSTKIRPYFRWLKFMSIILTLSTWILLSFVFCFFFSFVCVCVFIYYIAFQNYQHHIKSNQRKLNGILINYDQDYFKHTHTHHTNAHTYHNTKVSARDGIPHNKKEKEDLIYEP